MSTKESRRALAALSKEYTSLLRQREALDTRIQKLDTILTELAALCGRRAPTAQTAVSRAKHTIGFTDAVRLVLRRSPRPLAAKEVKQQLLSWGFDLSKYSNAMASIHVILNRLIASGQTKEVRAQGGKRAYRWATDIGKILASIEDIEWGVGVKK